MRVLKRLVVAATAVSLLATTVPAQAQAAGRSAASPVHTPAAAATGVSPGAAPATTTPATTTTPAGAAAARERPRPTGRLIAAPRAGARVGGTVVPIRVRDGFRIERARLNGTALGAYDFRHVGARRVLKASVSHGLKHGRNTVIVVARNVRTHVLVRQRTSFAATTKRHLTGVGRDQFVQVGSQVPLQAQVRLHPSQRRQAGLAAAATRAGTDPTLTWTVVRAPTAGPVLAPVSDPRAAMAEITAPGTYVLEATAAVGGQQTSDTLTVTAAESPMLTLDTEATQDGRVGIAIGSRFYPAPAATGPKWQLLVLDSASAQVLSNATYGLCENDQQQMCAYTSSGASPAYIPEVLQALVPKPDSNEPLSPNRLVVAASHDGYWTDSPSSVKYFTPIGISKDFALDTEDGPAAVVGIPGMIAGQANANPAGPLRGFLMLNQFQRFDFSPRDHLPFSTHVRDTCTTDPAPNGCTITVSLNGQEHDIPFGKTGDSPGGGIGVAWFDARSLALRGTASAMTQSMRSGYAPPGAVMQEIDGLITAMDAIPEDSLVIVSSAGPADVARMSPYGYDYDRPASERDRSKALADRIEGFGGMADTFNQSTRIGAGDYTLIGWPGAGPGNGREAAGQDVTLTGSLVPDELSRFRPAMVTENGGLDSQRLNQALFSPQGATPWPGRDDPGFMQAVNYLTGVVLGENNLGGDPRYAYWTTYPALSDKTGGMDGTWWVSLSNRLSDMRKAGTITVPAGATYSQQTLDDAADQLVREFGWVGNVRKYLELLSAPYLTLLSDDRTSKAIETIATNLKESSDDSRRNVPATVNWAEILAYVIELLTVIATIALPEAAFLTKAAYEMVKDAIEVWGAVGSFAFEVGGSVSESKESANRANEDAEKDGEYAVESLQLVTEILNGFAETAGTMVTTGNVITSDYGKLKDLGTFVTTSTCPANSGNATNCGDALWAAQQVQQTSLVSLQRTAAARVYQTLLPVTYDVVKIPIDNNRPGGYGDPEGNWDAGRFYCSTKSAFFDDIPARAKPFIYRSRESISLRDNSINAPTFQVYAIGIGYDTGYTFPTGNPKMGPPLEWNLNRMFAPVTGDLDWRNGGLGMTAADFIRQIPDEHIHEWSGYCGGWEYGPNDVPAPPVYVTPLQRD